MSNCCPPEPEKTIPSCCEPEEKVKQRPDFLLWVSATLVLLSYLGHVFLAGQPSLPEWFVVITSGIYELINTMWWGLAMAVVFVGLLDRIPRDLVMLGTGPGWHSKRHCAGYLCRRNARPLQPWHLDGRHQTL